jgi:ADP-ribosyl-[dinitrogen reductase] hydrolase
MEDFSSSKILLRAKGCLLGQVAGDSLGSLAELESPVQIEMRYPGGPSKLEDGGVWGTLAGQPTDDSEMALTLARSLIAEGKFDEEAVAQAYVEWLASEPFDIGGTTYTALGAASRARREGKSVSRAAREAANRDSQANGCLMRISPLGVFGVGASPADIWEWAVADASLTHPHDVCTQCTALFASTISFATSSGEVAQSVYEHARSIAQQRQVDARVQRVLAEARQRPPSDFLRQQGWVLIAFQNAFYQLLHAPSLEAGVINTVRFGGDTDTNAAIAGALLGAVHGVSAIPEQWANSVLNCRASHGAGHVRRPRPEQYWPVDLLFIAEALLANETAR